ncbi:LexA-binding, inner membrane-associated putative hydrolase [Acididesulfobacillus acetoxydans]|uniref:LexA-binding, inner membrane-associated putative hydrolase n=1 Tax=Acididesulfobacillus acetoxydans TaxID=1561005 RepID=A0A8S0W387_9FIRM|nr:metal-dependent hydrolase [Acididesulfobacillus acetoxydans]CAA7601418.1 LexA-binding, inner membrane-associated putative hydrolase [Acididesulfobacillus acetoxydans]CEJ08849.1 Membrane-bound metal-dependent hydrolase [Acididesulfobacillus acetoxydans]
MKTDPITHGLIGASLAVLSGHPVSLNDPVFLSCTLGAMLPDLDIVTHLKGRLNYLLKHRGASHSLLALGGMALGLTTVIYSFYPYTSWSTLFFWTLVGTLSHGLMDVLNSYGAELLWPFLKKKLTVDMIMLTDPVVFTLLLTALGFSSLDPGSGPRFIELAFAGSALYLGHRELSKLKVRDMVMSAYHIANKDEVKILPAMYRPFAWNFLLQQEDLVRFGTIHHKVPRIERVLPRWNDEDPYVTAAMEGNLAEIFDRFTPYYHIVARAEDEECKVEFVDLRYWTKEDFLYTGKVLVTADCEIAEEKFYMTNRNRILLSY